MFNFLHVNYNSLHSSLEAVKGGFIAWALLALSMGIIFFSVIILNKISSKNEKKKKEVK